MPWACSELNAVSASVREHCLSFSPWMMRVGGAFFQPLKNVDRTMSFSYISRFACVYDELSWSKLSKAGSLRERGAGGSIDPLWYTAQQNWRQLSQSRFQSHICSLGEDFFSAHLLLLPQTGYVGGCAAYLVGNVVSQDLV